MGGEDMFFVMRGTCEVLVELGQEVVGLKRVGEYFGEIALVLDKPRTAWVRARGFCILAKLTRDMLAEIMCAHPDQELLIVEQIVKQGRILIGDLEQDVRERQASELRRRSQIRCS